MRNDGPVNLTNGDTTLVTLTLPAGHWLLIGKLWANAVDGAPTQFVDVVCHLQKGGSVLDSVAFFIPKSAGSLSCLNCPPPRVSITGRPGTVRDVTVCPGQRGESNEPFVVGRLRAVQFDRLRGGRRSRICVDAAGAGELVEG